MYCIAIGYISVLLDVFGFFCQSLEEQNQKCFVICICFMGFNIRLHLHIAQ